MIRTKIQNEQQFMLQDEIYTDNIAPILKKELKRNIDLYGKVVVKGGIYANNLKIDAENVFIEKSVFVDDGIYIKSHEKGKVWFNSPVNAEQSILVHELSDVKIRFGKTVRSKKINLTNAIIYGNLIGEDIILKNCVIIGGVYCKKKLVVNNCIIGTYKTPELIVNNNLGMLHPIAVSEKRPQINGKLFFIIPKPDERTKNVGLYQLSQKEDILPLFENNKKKYVFSVTLRIFDLSNYYANIRENIERLFNATSGNNNNIEQSDLNFSEFDEKYFSYINNNFKFNEDVEWSGFMNINNKLIEDHILHSKNLEESDVDQIEKNSDRKIENTSDSQIEKSSDRHINSEISSNKFKPGDFIRLKEDSSETNLIKYNTAYEVSEIQDDDLIFIKEFPLNVLSSSQFELVESDDSYKDINNSMEKSMNNEEESYNRI